MEKKFRRIELLYPYFIAKEMTFADKIGLKNQKCFLQERVDKELAVITFFEGDFYFGDRMAIRKTLTEAEISLEVLEFLKSNSNLFLFGFFENSIIDFKAFAYFSRASRKIGFNKLASSVRIEPCFSGRLDGCCEYMRKNEGLYHIFFPLQELLFKF